MREQDHARAQTIFRKRDRPIAEIDLKPLLFGIIADGKVARSGHDCM
jgi:hypothetical protein